MRSTQHTLQIEPHGHGTWQSPTFFKGPMYAKQTVYDILQLVHQSLYLISLPLVHDGISLTPLYHPANIVTTKQPRKAAFTIFDFGRRFVRD